MLRRDPSASFEKNGFWLFSRFRFQSGALESEKSLSLGAYQRLQREQSANPIEVMADASRQRRWWLFQHEVYWEDDGYSALEVKALVLDRENQKQRRLQRALVLMEAQGPERRAGRPSIPQAVRLAVFQRDGGRCVSCGGDQGLEFDHVIPIALGGASTEGNLQLLCVDCNRAKGASIA
jgi:HNH endonuclease